MQSQKQQISSEITTITNNTLRMDSKEIADMLGKRHDNVKRTIERLVDKSIIQLPPLEEAYNYQSLNPNKKSDVFVFEGHKGKRDSIVVVAQLSPEVTARIVDRWQELEHKAAIPDFSDPIEAAYAWIDEKKKSDALEKQNKKNGPKVAIHDLYFSPKDPESKTMSQVAKVINKKRGLKIGRNQLYTILVEEKVLNKDYSLHCNYTDGDDFEVIINGKGSKNTIMVNPTGVKLIDGIIVKRKRLDQLMEEDDEGEV